MQFLEQAINFELLAGHATPTWAARVDAPALRAFCAAAHAAERR